MTIDIDINQPGGFEVAWDYFLENEWIMPAENPIMRFHSPGMRAITSVSGSGPCDYLGVANDLSSSAGWSVSSKLLNNCSGVRGRRISSSGIHYHYGSSFSFSGYEHES